MDEKQNIAVCYWHPSCVCSVMWE